MNGRCGTCDGMVVTLLQHSGDGLSASSCLRESWLTSIRDNGTGMNLEGKIGVGSTVTTVGNKGAACHNRSDVGGATGSSRWSSGGGFSACIGRPPRLAGRRGDPVPVSSEASTSRSLAISSNSKPRRWSSPMALARPSTASATAASATYRRPNASAASSSKDSSRARRSRSRWAICCREWPGARARRGLMPGEFTFRGPLVHMSGGRACEQPAQQTVRDSTGDFLQP